MINKRIIKSVIFFILISFLHTLEVQAETLQKPEFVRLEYLGVSLELPEHWLVTYPEYGKLTKNQPAAELAKSKVIPFFPGITPSFRKTTPVIIAHGKPDIVNATLMFGPQRMTQEELAKLTDKQLKRNAFLFGEHLEKKASIRLHGKVTIKVIHVNSETALAHATIFTSSPKNQDLPKTNYLTYIIPLKDSQIELALLYDINEEETMRPIVDRILSSLRF